MSNYFKNFPNISYKGVNAKDITRRAKVLESISNDPYAILPYTIPDGDRPEDVAFLYYGDVEKVWLVLLANNIIDPVSQWPMTDDMMNSRIVEEYLYECAICSINRSTPELFEPIFTNVATLMAHIGLNLSVESLDIMNVTEYNSIYALLQDKYSGIIYATVSSNVYDSNVTLDTPLEWYTGIFLTYLQNNLGDDIAYQMVRIPTRSELKSAFDVLEWSKLADGSITRNIVEYRNTTNEGEFGEVAISRSSYADLPAGEALDWTPIRIYDYEMELNENRRHINLVNAVFADQVQSELKRVINE